MKGTPIKFLLVDDEPYLLMLLGIGIGFGFEPDLEVVGTPETGPTPWRQPTG